MQSGRDTEDDAGNPLHLGPGRPGGGMARAASAPPPPPGAKPPPLWGDESHVRELFGDRVSDLTFRRQTVRMDHCSNPLEFREYWKRNYGPTIAAYRFNADQPDRVDELDRDFLHFVATWDQGVAGRSHWDAEYVVITATKR